MTHQGTTIERKQKPIEIHKTIKTLIEIQLKDNTKARVIDVQQKNEYVQNGKPSLRSQIETYRYFET